MNVIAYEPKNPMPLFWLLSMLTPNTEIRIGVKRKKRSNAKQSKWSNEDLIFVPHIIRKATDVIRVTKLHSRVLGHAPIVTEIGVTVNQYGRGFLRVCVG